MIRLLLLDALYCLFNAAYLVRMFGDSREVGNNQFNLMLLLSFICPVKIHQLSETKHDVRSLLLVGCERNTNLLNASKEKKGGIPNGKYTSS